MNYCSSENTAALHNYFVNAIFRSMGPLSIKSREQENETR